MGIETGRDIFETREAANQQTGADQKHDRKRELGNHEEAAEIVAASPYGACAG